ncbi:MAG: hypothetical protein ACRDM1_15275 [Gaiellaceae bacterium]
MTAKVADEVLPADLALLRFEVVVGRQAVGADDPDQVVAEQFLQPVAVATSATRKTAAVDVVVDSVRCSPARYKPASSILTASRSSRAARLRAVSVTSAACNLGPKAEP